MRFVGAIGWATAEDLRETGWGGGGSVATCAETSCGGIVGCEKFVEGIGGAGRGELDGGMPCGKEGCRMSGGTGGP